MNKKEINTFIEEMEAIGDEWTTQQVQDVYGDCTLEEALSDRKTAVSMFFNNIGNVLNM